MPDTPLLLIAAHGERGGDMTNSRLLELTSLVAYTLDGADVKCGTIAGEPRIDDILSASGHRRVLAYPFFMANGYFVDEVLSRLLTGTGKQFEILPPLGVEQRLVDTTANLIRDLQSDLPEAILVVAHGSSKDNRSRIAAEVFAARLQDVLETSKVSCCFLEEEPFADKAISALKTGSVIVNLFAGDGLHGGGDLPEIINNCGMMDIPVVTPAAEIRQIAQMIADTAFRALAARP